MPPEPSHSSLGCLPNNPGTRAHSPPPAISSCPCSPYQVLSCADYYLLLANTLTAISTGNRWHYGLCFALVELRQFLHGYSTIVIQLYHSDSSTRVYTADDSLFLYCKFKGSSNSDIYYTWQVLSTHLGPYKALNPNT